MDDAVRVDELKGQHQVREVKPHAVGRKRPVLIQVLVQRVARREFEEQIQVLLVVERIYEATDERIPRQFGQDAPFLILLFLNVRALHLKPVLKPTKCRLSQQSGID